MVSLADLRARNIVPTWQEAVAVVQELLHTIVAAQGSADRLPDLRHIALIANGDVVALPGSPATDHPVRHLATLLEHLLNGVAAPPQLEEFIQSNLADPPQIDTVEEFSMQLAFFERPGRRSDVEQLVARAMSTDAQLRAEEELRRLKAKTVEAAEHVDEEAEAAPAPRRLQSRQAVVVAALLLLALVVGGGVWWSGRSSSSQPQPAPEAEVAASQPADAPAAKPGDGADGGSFLDRTKASFDKTKASVSKAVRGALGGGTPQTSSPSTPAPAPTSGAAGASARPAAPAAQTSRTRNQQARRRAPDRRVPAPNTPAATVTPPPQVQTEVTTPPMEGEPPMSVATATEVRTIVYSAGDDGVMPALLLRPLLPAQPPPDVPLNQIGTLELVVNEHGDVERVRLVSPSNRFHERMLVAHAKTWKFRPAIRDGQPVKYRTVVRLTI